MTASQGLFGAAGTWSTRNPGIALTLVLMEGDADGFTTQSASFPDTDAGRTEAERLFEALKALAPAIARKREASLEDYCAAVSKVTGTDEATLFGMLDEFVRSDSSDVGTLQPVALLVERTHADGRLERMRFEHKEAYTGASVMHGYLLLHPISSQWLTRWD